MAWMQMMGVGPGGFEALLRRYRDSVHLLGENVRQADLAERAALAQLRAGDVGQAVDWYAANDRVAVRPDRDTAIDAVVEGWAADVARGADAAMYAWRRANVAELNRWGRIAWDQMGRFSGPELMAGATPYRAGDRIMTLAPGGDGAVVTSECDTVLAVDVRRRELAATMDDGRIQRFAGEDLDADHLAHGYAVTVHRAQGATVQRAHSLEDGGGRELAYVKMSRAKELYTVYVVADDLEQAVDNLRGSWAQSRRIGWAIDRGTPAPGLGREQESEIISASLRHARLVAERETLAAAIPSDDYDVRIRAEGRVRALEGRMEALDNADGRGTLRGTEVGEAAVVWRAAVDEWRCCTALAKDAGPPEAHRLRRQADKAAAREGPLRDRYEARARPERERVRAELPEARKAVADLEARYDASRHFAGVGTTARLGALDREIEDWAYDLDLARERLDGIAPTPQVSPYPEISWGPQREPPGLDRGIALEL